MQSLQALNFNQFLSGVEMSSLGEEGEYRIVHDFSYVRLDLSGREKHEHNRSNVFSGVFPNVERLLLFVGKVIEKNKHSLLKMRRCDFELYFSEKYICTLNISKGRDDGDFIIDVEKEHSQDEINSMVAYCFSESVVESDRGNEAVSARLREQGCLWANKQTPDDDVFHIRKKIEEKVRLNKLREKEPAKQVVSPAKKTESEVVPDEISSMKNRLMELKKRLDSGYDYSNRDQIYAGYELDMRKKDLAKEVERLKARFKGRFESVIGEIDAIADTIGLYDVGKGDTDGDYWDGDIEDTVF